MSFDLAVRRIGASAACGAARRQVHCTIGPTVLGPGEKNEKLALRAGGRRTAGGKWPPIIPFPDNNTIDGVLITFVDVTRIVEAEAHQRTLVQELNHRVRNMLTVPCSTSRPAVWRCASPCRSITASFRP